MTSRLRRFGPRSVLAFMLAFMLLVPVLLASPASASPKRLYGADISPHIVSPSTPVPFTFTLTNESKSQMIGSANLTAPSGFLISAIGTPSQGTATLVGNTIQLRNLALMPGGTATLTFLATTPTAPGVYTWLLDVRQANDFRGVGNSFAPDPAKVNLETAVGTPVVVTPCAADTSCSSGFVSDGTTTADVEVESGTTPAVLTVTLLPTDAISCTGYTGTSATVDFELIPAIDRSKTVTITIPSEEGRDLSSYEVCYSSPNAFMDKFGQTVNTGLLPDCTFSDESETPDNPPCVLASFLSGGIESPTFVNVSFFAPESDPKGHI